MNVVELLYSLIHLLFDSIIQSLRTVLRIAWNNIAWKERYFIAVENRVESDKYDTKHSFYILKIFRGRGCLGSQQNIAEVWTEFFAPINDNWLGTGAMGSIKLRRSWRIASVDSFVSSFINFSASDKFPLFPNRLRLNSILCTEQLWRGDIVRTPHSTENIYSYSGISAMYEAKRKRNRIFSQP